MHFLLGPSSIQTCEVVDHFVFAFQLHYPPIQWQLCPVSNTLPHRYWCCTVALMAAVALVWQRAKSQESIGKVKHGVVEVHPTPFDCQQLVNFTLHLSQPLKEIEVA